MLLFAHPAQSCADCENNSASGSTLRIHAPQESLNYSYCGCPPLINTAIVNSTDLFGHQVGPKTAYEKVNLTYTAAFNASKIASVVYNLTELGDKLVLLEYNITVVNSGDVNITGVMVNDSLLGEFLLGDLTPGQGATIRPSYTVNKSQIRYCLVNNTANITGTDRCCEKVNLSINNSFSINIAELEDTLHHYNTTIGNYIMELEENAKPDDIEKLEGILRNQSDRITTFDTLLRDAWIYIPG